MDEIIDALTSEDDQKIINLLGGLQPDATLSPVPFASNMTVNVPDIDMAAAAAAAAQAHIPENNYTNYSFTYQYPTSNHENTPLMTIAGIYALLFMLGTCGNAAILAVVYHVKSTYGRSKHNTTLTYIIILSVVDFLSMLPLPMTIADQILSFWMFGTFACKLFRLLEHIGKIFSTFILVAFSFDRYSAVCHPLSSRARNHKMVYLSLGSMFGVTCLMLVPILIYAHSKEYIMAERVDHANHHVMRLHIYKCTDDLGSALFIFFTLYCFLLAYLMPLLLMIYFYYGMLIRLYRQARAVRQALSGRRKSGDDKIPIGHIATYTLAICLFHFLCWTPYWMSVLHTVYNEVFVSESSEEPTAAFIYFMYGIHALPYVNSACNFILYGLLNRQLHNNPDKKCQRSTKGNQRTLQPTLKLTECSALMSKGVDSTACTPPTDIPKKVADDFSSAIISDCKQNGILTNGHIQVNASKSINTNSTSEEESILI